MARTDSTRTRDAKRESIARRAARNAKAGPALDLAALERELHGIQDERRTADVLAFQARHAATVGAPRIAV